MTNTAFSLTGIDADKFGYSVKPHANENGDWQYYNLVLFPIEDLSVDTYKFEFHAQEPEFLACDFVDDTATVQWTIDVLDSDELHVEELENTQLKPDIASCIVRGNGLIRLPFDYGASKDRACRGKNNNNLVVEYFTLEIPRVEDAYVIRAEITAIGGSCGNVLLLAMRGYPPDLEFGFVEEQEVDNNNDRSYEAKMRVYPIEPGKYTLGIFMAATEECTAVRLKLSKYHP